MLYNPGLGGPTRDDQRNAATAMSAPHESEDLTLPFTCPDCGDTATRAQLAQGDYSCQVCNLAVAHIELTPTGAVREVFGWLLAPGELLLDRYRVVNLLGRGGFAATYGVEDTRLADRRCALKEVPKLMFDRGEMEILSRLNHPGIPNIRDTFEQNDMVYLVLEFGGSRSLSAERVARGGRIPIETLLPWVKQLCDVLEYLHAQTPPIVHRDLKPGNVLVDENGRISLIDFGIAKESDGGTQTRTIARSASHGFSPPEQVMGTGTDQRSDVYALGATLYQLFTGHKPVPAHERVAGTDNPTPSSLVAGTPAGIDALIERSMELNINQRVQSIAEFAADLGAIDIQVPTPQPTRVQDDAPTVGGIGSLPDSLAHGETMVVTPEMAAEISAASSPSKFPVWLVALIGVVLVGAASAAWWLQSDPATPTSASLSQPTAEGAGVEPATAVAEPSEVATGSDRDIEPSAPAAETGTDRPEAAAAAATPVAEVQPPATVPASPKPKADPPRPTAPESSSASASDWKPPGQVDRPTAKESGSASGGSNASKPDWGGGFKKGPTRRID
jgi:serine/threonine-protein kinase